MSEEWTIIDENDEEFSEEELTIDALFGKEQEQKEWEDE